MKKNLMWWGKPSLLPFQKRISTQSTKQRNHKNLKKKDKPISNKSDKGKSFDKSRSTKITETEETEKKRNKSRSISSSSLSDKSNKIEKPKKIDIRKDNSSLFGMSGHGESVPSVTPDKKRIPQTLQSKENKLFRNKTTKVKYQNRILYLM